ncbi:penicillin-binding protein 1A [Pontibacter cellulosilyticus]|uniref:PBP1A family penicillin-binding protein n=1 Tax=Pontibacter cellulosilyticus TaxID=1720253 RepID=A0A923SK68_9BACT|nr:PBP1A family penicillin-binding protein [Pontibacter cellulosilyticus]MBC5994553.1 PBP1A family penicillin-binding protein [Pontibacter cellulosilyticus]
MKRTLKQIIKFIVTRVMAPFVRLVHGELSPFFRSLKTKFTRTYWQHKWAEWRESSSQNNYKFLFRIFYKLALVFILVLVLFYFAIYTGFLGGMPSTKELKSVHNNTASEVYAAGGELLGRYYIQDRTNVKYADISPAAIKALIATEDVRFYEHSGVDPRSLARVLVKSLLMQNESSGGGSTLSQQLAKNLYPRKNYWFGDMLVNKLREMIIARKLESLYSKEDILELYLNTVPLGGNLYGIERSAQRFFNKSAGELKTEEAAVLIGMLKATTTYNPRLAPEKSKVRRNVVLSQMAKYNYLTPAQADSLKQLPLKLDYNVVSHNDGLAPYFREQLRQELVQWAASKKKKNGEPYNLYKDGLKIYTTIDAGMQRHAESAVRKQMAQLQKTFDAHWRGRSPWGRNSDVIQLAMQKSDRYRKMQTAGASDAEIAAAFREPRQMKVYGWNGSSQRTMSPLDSVAYYQRFLNTGLFSVEPHTGYVRAWVGGINHTIFKYDHVRSKRQVGSTFKPIVYAAALERGIEPCDYFPNERITYDTNDNWSPRNADEKYGGEYTMRGALAHSVNTVSAQIIMKTGVDRTVRMAHRLGVESELPEVPSLALGTADLSLQEMVTAYATFANRGLRVDPVYITKITDRNGNIIRQHQEGHDAKRVISEKTAAIMLYLMQGVVEEGSASKLRSQFGLKMDIAGKTGTTQDNADGWFIGITPQLVTGVWVGGESPQVRFRTLELGQGSRTALPIWGDYIRRIAIDPAYKGYYNSKFASLPPSILADLNCASFRAEPPRENFLERVFNNVTEKAAQSFEEWKESWKKRREERKKEKRKKGERD